METLLMGMAKGNAIHDMCPCVWSFKVLTVNMIIYVCYMDIILSVSHLTYSRYHHIFMYGKTEEWDTDNVQYKLPHSVHVMLFVQSERKGVVL